jgi:hypothetical protein
VLTTKFIRKIRILWSYREIKMLIESYLTGRFQRTSLRNITSNCEVIKCGVPQGSILGSLFFLLYINDLPKIINKDNNMILFVDDTSIIITDTNNPAFNITINNKLQDLNTWFNVHLLTLNFNKTYYMEFRNKNNYNVNTQINYDQKCLTNSMETKFLGLIIDNTLSWKQQIEKVVSKLCSACYVLRTIKHILPQDTLRIFYFAHVHSIIRYGIIFWCNSSYAKKMFILQKKIIRIITNTRPRNSCKKVLKNMEKLTLYSQCIYSLILYAINNKHLFNTNNEVHNHKTRCNNDLHHPASNSSKFNKGASISGVKVFTHLPHYIKVMTNDQKCFKGALKKFLYHHSFYSTDEYYEYKEKRGVLSIELV